VRGRAVVCLHGLVAERCALAFDAWMRPSLVLGVSASLILGFGAGAWVFRGGEVDERDDATGREQTDATRDEAVRADRDDVVEERVREGRGARDEDEAREVDEGTARAGAPRVAAAAISSEELARRQRELDARIAEARRERDELFGAPVAAPANAPARFAATSIATSLRGALEAEGVEGEIEGVDCSEHPCIAFGRLRGDEEDVEEVERSPALDAYRDDVLVLLLWATTARDASPAPTAPEETATEETAPEETAIFALAFLPRDGVTESLERRIRARVFEVWNVERPGREALEPPAI
jgi:hypothetical protein